MMQVFIDRPPSDVELERLRLLLSTFQDGSGMLRLDAQRTLPGWRDFERSTALAFGGETNENKSFIDVVFPSSEGKTTFYGVDCKMRRELRLFDRAGRIYIEVTNAANWLWSYLAGRGIDARSIARHADEAGRLLIEGIERAKAIESSAYSKGALLIEQSYYFVLQWSTAGDYQLFQLPLKLPLPDDLSWYYRTSARSDGSTTSRLIGSTGAGVLYEWYGDSGGQFKYYPAAEDALWSSARFRLEPIPDTHELGALAKARMYFSTLWPPGD